MNELSQIAEFLREAKESLERQRHGPFDRGDGKVIMDALADVLAMLTPERYASLYRQWESELLRRAAN